MLQAGVVTALGTMSGTSLDGVDAAVLQTDGVQIHGFGPSSYRAYSAEEQAILHAHLGRWPDDGCDEAARIVEDAHLAVMQGFDGIEIAGFHGQTLAHDPADRRTHQCGDGARLARQLSLPVAWDFRTADVKAGGQGAPLAPYFHFALAKWIKAKHPIGFLNLGGVGNLTWIDPSRDAPSDPDALLAFDTGPANAPMNDLMQQKFQKPFDKNGARAMRGSGDASIVEAFLAHPYFSQPAPKSLDRDAFDTLLPVVATLETDDAMATLADAAVSSVCKAMELCPSAPTRLLITGGGRHNEALMSGLTKSLECLVSPVEEVGLDGDMLEAQAFAFLAVRAARGLPISGPTTTGVTHPMTGGIISGTFKTEG